MSSFGKTPSASRSDCIRDSLIQQRFSLQTAEFILQSWAKGTKKQYESAWSTWCIWNSIRKSDPLHASEAVTLNYLFYLFKLGKSYSVINTHKAMLLQTLLFLGNVWCKSSVLFPRFMKSVFQYQPFSNLGCLCCVKVFKVIRACV